MRIIIVNSISSYYIEKKQNNFEFFLFLNEYFFIGEIKYKYMNERDNPLPNTSFFSTKNYYRSQLIQQLDCWSFWVISLGFILLTIGILSGTVWANETWGSYWNWDPKETWAFITWIIFVTYLHTRTTKNTQGSNSAIIAFIGFFIIWICYFWGQFIRNRAA